MISPPRLPPEIRPLIVAMHRAGRRWASLLLGSNSTLPSRSTSLPALSHGAREALRPGELASFGRGFRAGPVEPEAVRKTGWTRRVVTVALGTGLVGAAAWVASGEHPTRRATMLYSIPLRLARDVTAAAAMIADYKYSLYGLKEGSAEREEAKHEAHVRCANRLQALCFKNGGIYIKLGQHIGQLDYLLPEEYVKVMRASMLDKCPVSTYKQVCDVFTAELGRLPDETCFGFAYAIVDGSIKWPAVLFVDDTRKKRALPVWRHEVYAEFDRVPLASASLAQVHAARTFDGQKIAVKVQHMHLTDSALADTATVDLIVNVVHWFFPSFDYRWLLAEVRDSLPKELDFLNEGKNCEKSLENFKKLSPKLASQISLPHVYWELSTQRVLAMEFMDGVGVTDVEALKALGLRPADVARLVSQTFAEMIFRHGFVHCDPHAANMMIRVKPGTREPQLVLLDHGLYKTLDPVIQSNYAGLWKALVFADSKEIKEHCIGLGAGDDLYALFAAILTMRPWDKIVDQSIDHLIVPDTAEEREELQGYASQYFWEVSALLSRLPRVVLLLLKTNDCLRAVDNALGAPVNTYLIVARTSSKAVSEMERKGLFSNVLKLWDKLDLEFRLLTWKAAALLTGIKHYMKRIGFS